jgi:hypothetical protein
MALRIDWFAVQPGADVETLFGESLGQIISGSAADGPVRWLGFASANDADEAALHQLLDAVAQLGYLAGAGVQGVGVQPETLTPQIGDQLAAMEIDSSLRPWLDVIAWSIEAALSQGRALGWLTRFDAGGSIADGQEEWPTSWSDLPLGDPASPPQRS